MNGNDYDPERVTVGSLFKHDNQLVIPRFQRSYEWKEANIEEFYNDFVRTSDDRLTFLGNIVLDGSKHGVYEVIDGQQRLITLTILCAAIRDILREDIKCDSALDLASKIDTTYLRSGVSFSVSTESLFKLRPSRELEEFFYAYIQHGGEKARKMLPRQSSHKNVAHAYSKFRRLLVEEKLSSNIDDESKVKFLGQTMEYLHMINLITITIYNQDAAYSIFESFNAKRVDLSVSDLVKNYYFSKLKGPEEEISKNMDRWDRLVANIVSIPGGRVDKFLHYYLQSQEGKFTRAQLYRKTRQKIDEGADKFIKRLESATEAYAQLKDANIQSTDTYQIAYESLNRINGALEGINRFNVEQCFILLLAILLNRQKFSPIFLAKIVELIENFTFIYSKVSNGQANAIEKLYSELAREITETSLPADTSIFSGQIYSRLKKHFAEILPSYQSFEADFIELDYSNPQHKRLIFYIFEKTELAKTRGGSMLGNMANIDHIFPQNPTGVKRPTKYNKIGNLLPIDRDTNSSVGNKLPAEKISLYEGIKNITQIADLLDFVENNGCDVDDEWIRNRGSKLAQDAYELVWKIT